MISAGDRVFDVRNRLAGTVVSVDRLGSISVAFVRYSTGEIRPVLTLGLRRIGAVR